MDTGDANNSRDISRYNSVDDDSLLDDYVVENSPMVVFQELKEEKMLNFDRNLYLNARKISYVTLIDVIA